MGINVVIIGAGLSGLMAARELSKDEHIHVQLLSTGTGASPFVHGFNMPLAKEDSIDCFKQDTLKSGHFLCSSKLVDILCGESLKIFPILRELGIELDKKDGEYCLLKPLGSTYPRVACCGNHTGALIMRRIRDELTCRQNVTFRDGTRALRILVENRKAKGLIAFNLRESEFYFIETNCIVLAGGGFSGIYPFNTNPKDIGGDIIAMAYEAGASLTDLEFIQFEPTVALHPLPVAGKGMITTMFYDGAVLRNKNGERFMLSVSENAERVNKDVMAKAIYEEVMKGNGTEHGGVYFDATGVGWEKLLERYSSYVTRYEKVGIDISREMFEVAPAPHTTLGGLVIDEYCETSVAGIFAAGESVGGIHGANRIGGNAGLETMVFGSLAGKSAREYVKNLMDAPAGEPIPYRFDNVGNGMESIETVDIERMRKEMRQLLADSFNVIRNGKNMKNAGKKLGSLLEEIRPAYVRDNITKYKALRLENDLICSCLLAASAITRTNSVGCHIREDAVLEDKKYNVVLEKGESGPLIHKKYQKGDTDNEEN